MFSEVIDGFTARIRQAIAAKDYDELRQLDSACLRYLSENSPATIADESLLPQIMASLDNLRVAYRDAVTVCTAARDQVGRSLQTAGRGRRNAGQYLDVARNLGR